jgi:hypothetical protein
MPLISYKNQVWFSKSRNRFFSPEISVLKQRDLSPGPFVFLGDVCSGCRGMNLRMKLSGVFYGMLLDGVLMGGAGETDFALYTTSFERF